MSRGYCKAKSRSIPSVDRVRTDRALSPPGLSYRVSEENCGLEGRVAPHHNASENSDRTPSTNIIRSVPIGAHLALVRHRHITSAPAAAEILLRRVEIFREKNKVKFWTGAQIANWNPQPDRGHHAALRESTLRARKIALKERRTYPLVTAIRSISIRKSGCDSLVTPTRVLGGGRSGCHG
jgi:hypothetical protein